MLIEQFARVGSPLRWSAIGAPDAFRFGSHIEPAQTDYKVRSFTRCALTKPLPDSFCPLFRTGEKAPGSRLRAHHFSFCITHSSTNQDIDVAASV